MRLQTGSRLLINWPWEEAVYVSLEWSQGHLTVDKGQGQGGVMGEAGCEDGAGPQGKEGEQPLEVGEDMHFKPAGNHNFILAKQWDISGF